MAHAAREDVVPRPAAQPPSGGVPIGRLVVGGLLVVLGVLWLLDTLGVAALSWQVVLPAALTVVGVALLATAHRPGHGGLVAVAVVLSVLVVASSLAPAVTPFAGGGDRVERPTSLADGPAAFRLAMGTLTVDLRDADAEPGGFGGTGQRGGPAVTASAAARG